MLMPAYHPDFLALQPHVLALQLIYLQQAVVVGDEAATAPGLQTVDKSFESGNMCITSGMHVTNVSVYASAVQATHTCARFAAHRRRSVCTARCT